MLCAAATIKESLAVHYPPTILQDYAVFYMENKNKSRKKAA